MKAPRTSQARARCALRPLAALLACASLSPAGPVGAAAPAAPVGQPPRNPAQEPRAEQLSPRAELVASPTGVVLGQPMEWILRVEHPAGSSLLAPAADPVPDDTWLLLDGPRRRTEKGADGMLLTVVSWRVMSLQPGERDLPPLELRFEDGTALGVGAGTVRVRGELGVGEEVPRPLRGLHPIEERTAEIRWRRLALVALLLVVLPPALALLLRRRRRRAAAPEPTPREELAALRLAAEGGPAAQREAMFALTNLVRGALDRYLGRDLAGRTDEEWRAALEQDGRLEAVALERAAAVLTRCTAVKYGGQRPSPFHVRETLDAAQAVLAGLEPAAASAGAARELEAVA